MSECRFTYERARRGYDAAFVDALAEHIVEAIARASIVSDEPRVMAIRSTETVEALTRVLCTIAATNPDFDQKALVQHMIDQAKHAKDNPNPMGITKG